MEYIGRLKHNTSLYIGYPPAVDFKLSQYAELLDYSMNSLGNPYDLNNILPQ
jgi:histidine decarboxylase